MEQSILKSTKKVLGVAPDDPTFDLDIMTHINAAFSVLADLGIGPREGFVIEDDELTWEDFFELGENHVWMGKVKPIIYMRTRLAFDPPTSQFLLDALQKQLQEHEWRLSANREAAHWVDPVPTPLELTDVFGEDPIEVEGGGA